MRIALVRSACALLLATVAALGAAHSAYAAPAAAQQGADETETAGSMVLVLDSSGSMAEPASGGQSKIQAAKQALNTVIDGLPGTARVGLRVYGSEVFSADDPGACTDSELKVPVGPVDRQALKDEVSAYEPYGETPIAHSLKQAAGDLGSEGQRSIVLVSDGEETCDPDPCAVAERIAEEGIDLRVDVVGLNISGKARRQMQCIADAGGGQYYGADDADELADALAATSKRAFRPFGVSGQPVRGATEPEQAPTVRPGQYIDRLGGDQEETGVKYYRVPHSPGSTPHVAVTGRPEEADQDDGVDITISTPSGEQCIWGQSGTALAWLQQNPVLTAQVTFHPWQGSNTEACEAADHLVVEVRRGSEGKDYAPDTGEMPIELRVIVEPPVTNGDQLYEMVDEADLWAEPVEEQEPEGSVTGGATFTDAPELGEGTWTDTAQAGEMLFYKVRTEWGQAPTLTVRFSADSYLAKQLATPGIPLILTAYAPDRMPIDLALTDNQTEALYLGDEVLVSVTLPEVRYHNRNDISEIGPATGPIGPTSLAGFYYFGLQVKYAEDGERHELDTRISVDLYGERSDGPEYEGGVDPMAIPEPEQDDASGSGAGSGSGEGGSDARAGGESGSGSGSSSREGDAGSAAAEESGGFVPLAAGGGIGVGVLAAMAVAILLLRRARRPARAEPHPPAWYGPPGVYDQSGSPGQQAQPGQPGQPGSQPPPGPSGPSGPPTSWR